MKYLYGDATNFPRQENFLATLQAIIRAAVALVRAAHARSEEGLQASKLQADAARDQRALRQIAERARQALLQEQSQELSSRVLAARGHALEALQGRVEEDLRRIDHQLDKALAEGEALARRRQRALRPVMERLLLEREIPDMVWGCTWEAGMQRQMAPGARAVALHPGGLEASFRIEIEPESPWTSTRRVRDIVGEVAISMPARVGLRRRREGMVRRRLGALFIAAVDAGPKRTAVLLKRKLTEEAPGYLLTRVEGGHLEVEAVNNAHELGLSVAAEHQPELFALIDHLSHGAHDLVAQREEVTAIRFGNQGLADLAAPEELAMMLLDAVGPLTREIARRSPNRHEICLKRDLGGRRREELYLPVAELRALVDELPPSAHAPFRALGIFGENQDEGEVTGQSSRVIIDLARSA